MDLEPLPPNLRELEERLARRPGPQPVADFRARVLRATTDTRSLPVPQRPGWRRGLVWRAAAVVVLAVNLGMSAGNGIRFQRLNSPDPAQPAPRDGVLVQDRFQALAARALATWTAAPDLGTAHRNLFSMKEERGWDMP